MICLCLYAGEFPTRNTSLYLPCTVCAQRKRKPQNQSQQHATAIRTYIYICNCEIYRYCNQSIQLWHSLAVIRNQSHSNSNLQHCAPTVEEPKDSHSQHQQLIQQLRNYMQSKMHSGIDLKLKTKPKTKNETKRIPKSKTKN